MNLSKNDKYLINQIANSDHIGNIVDPWLNNFTIDINLEQMKCTVNLHAVDYTTNPQKYMRPMEDYFNPIINRLWSFVNLLEKLENKGLIRFVDRNNIPQKEFKMGAGCLEEQAISCSLPDEHFNKLLAKYGTKFISKQPEFYQFTKRGYVLHEDWQWRWKIRIALGALIISAIGVSINVYCNQKNAANKTIQNKAFSDLARKSDLVLQHIDSMNNSIDSVKNILHARDPIKSDKQSAQGQISSGKQTLPNTCSPKLP